MRSMLSRLAAVVATAVLQWLVYFLDRLAALGLPQWRLVGQEVQVIAHQRSLLKILAILRLQVEAPMPSMPNQSVEVAVMVVLQWQELFLDQRAVLVR